MIKRKPRSEESKRKQSLAMKGKPCSEETRKKISLANKIKCRSKEFKKKMSENILERYANDPEFYKKICELNRKRANDPIEKELRKERMKKVWARDDFKNPTSLGTKRSSEFKKYISNINKGKRRSEEVKIKMSDGHIGHWYGNVKYDYNPVYCELWRDVNPRVHAFQDHKCFLCGEPEDGKSHAGHHIFYVKEACCLSSEGEIYYTNLNAKDHPKKDYCIGANPNYFVILCNSCHAKTNGNFEKRKMYADYFKQTIDEYYGGKSYFTKEEYSALFPTH